MCWRSLDAVQNVLPGITRGVAVLLFRRVVLILVGRSVVVHSPPCYICGSGNAYCGSVKPTYVSTSDTSDCSDVDFPDLTAETLLVFQDVQIAGVNSPARLVWDDGSTRGLVTQSM